MTRDGNEGHQMGKKRRIKKREEPEIEKKVNSSDSDVTWSSSQEAIPPNAGKNFLRRDFMKKLVNVRSGALS